MATPSPVRIAVDLLKPTLGNAVHAEIAPAGTPVPFATVRLIGWDDERVLQGLSDSGRAHVGVSVLGSTFAEADGLAIDAVDALNGYSGVVDGWHVQVMRDGPSVSDWIAVIQAFRMNLSFELTIGPVSA
jgi:hypothetical protein